MVELRDGDMMFSTCPSVRLCVCSYVWYQTCKHDIFGRPLVEKLENLEMSGNVTAVEEM